jgi:hypothetical protein
MSEPSQRELAGVFVKPVLQALVIAEQIYKTTEGKFVICGTFDGVVLDRATSEKPQGDSEEMLARPLLRGGIPGSPYAYISLTDVCDGTQIALQFVSLRRNHVIFGQQLMLTGANRLDTVVIVAPLPKLPITEPGAYAFEVVCDGEIVGSSRITAKERPLSEDDE